jgi:hypothetical protein
MQTKYAFAVSEMIMLDMLPHGTVLHAIDVLSL